MCVIGEKEGGTSEHALDEELSSSHGFSTREGEGMEIERYITCYMFWILLCQSLLLLVFVVQNYKMIYNS